MSRTEEMRTALYGNPPSSNHQPSTSGVLAAFGGLDGDVSTLSKDAVDLQSKNAVDLQQTRTAFSQLQSTVGGLQTSVGSLTSRVNSASEGVIARPTLAEINGLTIVENQMYRVTNDPSHTLTNEVNGRYIGKADGTVTLSPDELSETQLTQAVSSSDPDTSSLRIGFEALNNRDTTTGNTVFGRFAGYPISGNNNVVMGYRTAYRKVNLNSSVAIGKFAMAGIEGSKSITDNVVIGAGAGFNLDSSETVAIGANALNQANGTAYTVIGAGAGSSTITGSRQTIIGYSAQGGPTNDDVIAIGHGVACDASSQIAIGTGTQTHIKMLGIDFARYDSGAYNLWLGNHGPAVAPTGQRNLGIGKNALNGVTTGSANIAMGEGSLELQSTASNTLAIGVVTAQFGTALADCTYIGNKAGRRNVTGTGATVVGFRAHEHNASAQNNTCFGDSALWHTQGGQNIAIGYVVAEGMSKGDRNIILGMAAARARDDGDDNIFIGFRAGSIISNNGNMNYVEPTGNNPLADIGGVATGHQNVGIGTDALAENLGSGTVGIGHLCGKSLVGSAAVAGNNVFVGHSSGNNVMQKSDAVNSVAIGADTFTTKDNQVVIGSATVTETVVRGVVVNSTFLVSQLPSSDIGARSFVTDATSVIFGSPVTGGGSLVSPVYYDGSVWRCG